jgi:putative membrane protein
MAEKDLEQRLAEVLTEPYVRDFMAVERTIMANERTFLSYIRAALALFISGVSFIQFFKGQVMQMVGWIFIPLGGLAFGLGLVRYTKIKNLIQKAETVTLSTTNKSQ